MVAANIYAGKNFYNVRKNLRGCMFDTFKYSVKTFA